MLGKHISLNSSPNKVVQGSRFEALSTDEELNAHETASTITRIREMIISAGLIPSAKGKDVSDVGVGSSKGRATAGVSQVSTNMRNKENNVASNPSKSALVASNGTAVQVYSSLSKLNHVAVRVIDDDLGGVLSNLNWRSMSGPIRNSVLDDWVPLSLANADFEDMHMNVSGLQEHLSPHNVEVDRVHLQV
ncbi:hypothetical protein V6N12_065539 [Hibiscus sabdariffa]|uniref:Uncharacterized protein n=1 Tax=Hibiscus sabdariffa TaxID=183260 RepID=A0ABR2G9G9_9ROSI